MEDLIQANSVPADLTSRSSDKLSVAINAVTQICKMFPDGSAPRLLMYHQRAAIAVAVLSTVLTIGDREVEPESDAGNLNQPSLPDSIP